MIQMRMGSEGLGIQAGAQMRMGPIAIDNYQDDQIPTSIEKQLPILEAIEVKTVEVVEEVSHEWGDISPVVIGKFQKAGFTSINDFLGKTREELLAIEGIGERVAEQILSFNK